MPPTEMNEVPVSLGPDHAHQRQATQRTHAQSGATVITERRRVLILVENLPVPFDRRVWQEATSLTEAGYEVTVICPKGKGLTKSHEFIEGIHVYRHPLPRERGGPLGYLFEYGSALFWEFLLTTWVALTRGFDVVHACNPPDLIVLVAAPFKLFGKRFVFDHHDISPELYEVKFGRRDFFYRLLRRFERLTYALADVSIATNESYRQIAIQRGRMKEDRVFVVRSSPDSNKFRVPIRHTRQHSDSVITVGYIGIMGDQDGVDGLLRIARTLVHERKRDDIRFVLIGSGPELERLHELAAELDLADHVQFTGYLSGKHLIASLASIDIGAVPDPKNDYTDKCTMNKIMEYMALEKPIVQYDLSEGRRSAGDSSLYARPGDEAGFADLIERLAEDPALRKELGRRGKARFESVLDWQFEVPKLLAAYDKVFTRPS